jgi:hypothetical protein
LIFRVKIKVDSFYHDISGALIRPAQGKNLPFDKFLCCGTFCPIVVHESIKEGT